MDFVSTKLTWLPKDVAHFLEKNLKKVPFVKDQIEAQYDGLMKDLEKDVRPYKGEFDTYTNLPETGRSKEDILAEMREYKEREASRWQDGYVSGAVYHGNDEHIDFLNEVYAINSQVNPLHSDLWPSATKFEAEIIAMTANMLGAEKVPDNAQVCGAVSSGGTESILLAMKVYRDWAIEEKGIKEPEMIVPVTAHAAFDKAAQFFKFKMVKVPITDNYQVDIRAVKKAINKNTAVIVGSAPAFPHGIMDPIEELSRIAYINGVGLHVDACLGGFMLPWAEKLGYPVPAFDFRLRGVTSMSADTHKYGYAAKGTSVVLYRNPELRHYQYFTTTDWPGGMYFSPTFAGSRPGALSAACWASMVSIGEQGYLDASKRILETAAKIKEGINAIPELNVMGDPLWVVAFQSDSLNIYDVMGFMTKRHWNLNGLHKPSCVHIAVTLPHTKEGVAERFLYDLQEAVEHVKNSDSGDDEGMAPVYGMAATIPFRGMISDILKRYMDVLYKA